TPESLQLYLEYVNAFAAWALPADLMDSIGLPEPGRAAAIRACRNYGASFRTRSPGFEEKDAGAARVRSVAQALGERWEPGPWADTSIARYYRDIYPSVRAECARLWPEIE